MLALRVPALTCLLALAASACQGAVEGGASPWADADAGALPTEPADPGVTNPGSAGADPVIPDPERPGAPGTSAPGSDPAPPADPGVADVNRVPIHRLNNTEYDHSVHDVLGVSSRPGTAFIADETLFGFDNIAAAGGMSDARFEQYFDAAEELVDEAFADQALRDRLLVCEPAGDTDEGCAREILSDIGLRALRRPPTEAQLERWLALFGEAVELGEDFEGGIRQALRAILASARFLYRIEIDPAPDSGEKHALDGYELASRLSYLVWSAPPDQKLYAAAEKGELADDARLSAELDRLLADARSAAFSSSFAGQWLGLKSLASHQVSREVFPDFDEALRSAMIEEGERYFDQFLREGKPVSEFFTADVLFVNAPLAQLYGVVKPAKDFAPVVEAGDARRGFLGLAGFLTLTSFAERSAPTLRGKWVQENLLCSPVPPPPATVPELETEGGEQAGSDNVRERLERHRADPDCAGCHRLLDPIGLGLENFDALGAYRNEYANGDAVDASGELPDGRKFTGLLELSTLLADDPRFADCATRKLLTYALSREVVATDTTYLKQIREAWTADGLDFASLLRRIVLNESFRFRRGEPG
ncbi:MAG: DUF1592 domain-containing protein [Myxococcota bacterium]|nr:DUF1592 domain-containing protein [Myxococcota bacterium]